MKTEDLIANLAAQPAPPPLLAPRIAWQMAAATALSAALVLAVIGIRDDLLTAMTGADWTLTFRRLATLVEGDVLAIWPPIAGG